MNKKQKILCFFVLAIGCGFPGSSQVKNDSVLKANSEKWTGQQNKHTFEFGKPSFGPFTTLAVLKIDTHVVTKKTKEGTNTSLESSGGKNTFEQTKTVNRDKTTWYRLLLGNGTDTTKSVFGVTISTRKQKKTFLGSIFGKPDDDNNRDDYYDNYYYHRNVEGTVSVNADSLQWTFHLSNYVNKIIGGGYFKNDRDSLLVKTYNASGFSTEIILADRSDNHIASVLFNKNDIEIYVHKELDRSHQLAIAGLFAVIVSIKK